MHPGRRALPRASPRAARCASLLLLLLVLLLLLRCASRRQGDGGDRDAKCKCCIGSVRRGAVTSAPALTHTAHFIFQR